MNRAILAGVIMTATSAALAAPLTSKEARAALFRSGLVEVVVLDQPFLTEQDRTVLEQVASEQKYYGAISFGPDDGLLSESLTGAFNYHDVASARTAALAGCEAQRNGQAACEVVAELRPRGWEAGRAISLSGDATEAFRTQYRNAKTPKALAISPSTGLFAIALDPAAPGTALAQCEAMSQAQDCSVVLSE